MTPDPTPVPALGSSWRAASGRTRILVRDDQREVHRTLDHALVERYSYEFASIPKPRLSSSPGSMNVLRQRDIAVEKQAEARQEGLAVARERAIEELHGSRQETVECLARAIEMHDAETGQHVKRMGSIAAFLGDLLRMAGKIALTHHERWDGNGYPLGLSGEGIPLEGRIVAVVDVFDALLSDRCYWPAMSVDAVAATIREGRGSQFDPQIVDALLNHLDEALRLRSVHP